MLPSPHRVLCALPTSVARIKCSSLTREAGAQLPSALRPNAAVAAPSAMYAAHERASLQVHQPHTRSRHRAALSAAAQCCCRRVPCTLSTSVTHDKCAGVNGRQAASLNELPSVLQPNAAIGAPGAMHTQPERDSHQECQPHTRSRRPAALSTAANAAVAAQRCNPMLCHRGAECHARSTQARPTSSAPAPHEKPVPSCSQRCSAMLLSPRRVPCPLKSVTHMKCTSLTRERLAADRRDLVRRANVEAHDVRGAEGDPLRAAHGL